MKKISMMAAAAALTVAAAAPVAADTKNDPFVSTQASVGLAAPSMAVVGLIAVGIIVAAADGS
ncbi:MAG: hypothetical protein CSA70_09705 [Rhodobacterales bacterium]|nr:MAG: hypothetical protein CSA70_09705 [Rhodobacterales bacterium]